MAKIGAKFPCWKSNATGVTAGITLGKLNQANVTINMVSGELYGDDIRAEYVSEFGSGQIALETTSLTDSDAEALFGHTSSQGVVTCKVGDEAPEGTFSYYRVMMVNGEKSYRAFTYPRVRAVLGNESDQTKGNTINFTTDSVTFEILTLSDGTWRTFETFDTEAAAETFVKTACGIT